MVALFPVRATGDRLRFGGDSALPNHLRVGDCLAAAAAAPDASADLVYLDPPFGTGATRRGRGGRSYSDDRTDPTEFVHWLSPTLEHARRALTPSGSLLVHLDYRAVHYVKVALDRLFGPARFVNEIIWSYSVGGKSRRSFGRKHDTILWYARGADYAFYPDAVSVPRKPSSHMRTIRDADGRLVQEKTDRKTGKVYRYPVDAGKIPDDTWTDIETLNRSDRERCGWPTQKPARLLARIVHAITVEGDAVIDWFCGSGTTAVVAQRFARRFCASDASADAIDVAATRLAHEGSTLPTAPPDVAIDRIGA